RCSSDSSTIAVGSLKAATRVRPCAMARPMHTIAAVSLAVSAFIRVSVPQAVQGSQQADRGLVRSGNTRASYEEPFGTSVVAENHIDVPHLTEFRRPPRLKRTVISPGHYSFLNATVGSRREARNAGSAAARIATAINNPAAESNVSASLAFTL